MALKLSQLRSVGHPSQFLVLCRRLRKYHGSGVRVLVFDHESTIWLVGDHGREHPICVRGREVDSGRLKTGLAKVDNCASGICRLPDVEFHDGSDVGLSVVVRQNLELVRL